MLCFLHRSSSVRTRGRQIVVHLALKAGVLPRPWSSPLLQNPLPSPGQNFIERTQQDRGMCSPLGGETHCCGCNFIPPQFPTGPECRTYCSTVQAEFGGWSIHHLKPQACCTVDRACCFAMLPIPRFCKALSKSSFFLHNFLTVNALLVLYLLPKSHTRGHPKQLEKPPVYPSTRPYCPCESTSVVLTE